MKSLFKPIRQSLIGLACLLSVVNAQQKQSIATEPAVSPSYSLTSQEGVGLELVSFKANAVIDGPLAFTQLELTFKNPEDRTIEGRFKVVMPDQASMSRFAMKINDQWMEGEIVEKQAARRAYEDALHRRQDPALLEQEAGNEFSARIFPIPGKSEKSIIISWSQERGNPNEEYRLPLIGLPKIKVLELNAQIAQDDQAGLQSSIGTASPRKYLSTKISEKDFEPKQDWVLSLDAQAKQQINQRLITTGEAFKEGKYFLTRVQINEEPKKNDQVISHAVILFDTSASNLIGFDQKVDRLGEFIAQLESKLGIAEVELILFDQEVKHIYQGKASAFNKDILNQIKEREALGASHFESALSQIKTQNPYRIFLFSDGMVSLGKTDRSELSGLFTELSQKGLQRVDAIVENSARDKELLQKLVESKNLKPGKVILDATVEQQLDILSRHIFEPIQVSVTGAKWIWPTVFTGVQKGDVLLVYAELENTSLNTELKLSGAINQSYTPALGSAPIALLERSWVKARIQKLLDQMGEQKDIDFKEAMKKQIIELSTKYRVLSPLTAMVVLETEQDYERFQIKRNALSDILMVGVNGITTEHRTQLVLPTPAVPTTPVVNRTKDAVLKRAGSHPNRARMEAQGARDDSAEERKEASSPSDGAHLNQPMTTSAAPGEMAPVPSMPMAESSRSQSMAESKAKMAMNEALEEEEKPSVNQLAQDKGDQEDSQEKRTEAGADEILKALKKSDKDQPSSQNKMVDSQAQTVEPISEFKSKFIKQERERRKLMLAQAPQRPLILINPNAIKNINKDQVNALTGDFSEVDIALRDNQIKKAESIVKEWREKAPVDILSLIAKGKIFVAQKNHDQAARAFGSLVDFFPSRADMIRLSANWLEQLGHHSLEIVLDMYLKALDQRPDHPVIYHLLAMTLAKLGRFQEGINILIIGLNSGNWESTGRFSAVRQILIDDIQALIMAWQPKAKQEELTAILKQIKAYGIAIDQQKTARLRVILSWETDANDVDFHIRDKDQNHAYYSSKNLASGGSLYADITTGYGPECFLIEQAAAYPYQLQAHYYSKGPMGYGGGKVQVIEQNAEGQLLFEERPFVIMVDGAYLDLGEVKKPNFKD